MGLCLFTRFIKIIILLYIINGLTIFSELPIGFKNASHCLGLLPIKNTSTIDFIVLVFFIDYRDGYLCKL